MRVSPITVLCAFLQLSGVFSSASSIQDCSWIELPASYSKRDYMRAVAEVRRYALSAGYYSDDDAQIRDSRLALLVRGDLDIDFVRSDGICRIFVTKSSHTSHPSAVAERQRLLVYLGAHGIKTKVVHGQERVIIY